MRTKISKTIACSGILAMLTGSIAAAAADAHPFKYMDPGKDLPKLRKQFSDQAVFPNAPVQAADRQRGFRISEIDLTFRNTKDIDMLLPAASLDRQIDLVTARGEYTIGCFGIFAYDSIDRLEVIPTALVDESGNRIEVSEIKIQEYSYRGAVPRFQYAQMLYEPNLENLQANEQLLMAMLVNVPENTPGGLYKGQVAVRSSKGSETLAVNLYVGDFTLGQYGSFGFYYNGNLYRKIQPGEPHRADDYDISQKKLVPENIGHYFAFLKSRRFNSISLYDHTPELHYVDGKVTGYFEDGAKWAKAMKDNNMTGYFMYDLRNIGYWANAVAKKLEQLGGKAPAGDIGIDMRHRKIETKVNYSEKAKEIYAEAIKLLLKQAKEENWPDLRIFADEELGNIGWADGRYKFKEINYESYMPVIMKTAPANAVVIDNTIGYGKSNVIERGLRDNVKLRQYNSWTDESLALAERDQAEVMTFNYGPWRMQTGFLQVRTNSSGHHQWADLWDASNFQWQYSLLTDTGVVSSIDSERMHEGIVDYAACCYLKELIAATADEKLAAYGKSVLKLVSEDIPVEHQPSQKYALTVSNDNLSARRLLVFQTIELLSGKPVTGKLVPGKAAFKVEKNTKRSIPKQDYILRVKNIAPGADTVTPSGVGDEKFWSPFIGPLKFLAEYESQLMAFSSSIEEFNRINVPSYAVGRLASLPEGLAIYTRGNNVTNSRPYNFERQDDDKDMDKDDTFEVSFILPKGPECRLVFNAAGKKTFFRDGKVIPAKDIKSYFHTPVHKGGGTTNKLIVPWKYFNLKQQPQPGTAWRFNLARSLHTIRGPLEALSSWARLNKSFDEKEKWGQLVFTADGYTDSVKSPASLMVTPNIDTLVHSGSNVKFYFEASRGSDGKELRLQLRLRHSSGKSIALPQVKLTEGAGDLIINTAGLAPGEWSVEPKLSSGKLLKSNIVKFFVLPSPFIR